MAIQPILLVGTDLESWKYDIRDAFQWIFDRLNTPIVKEVIKLDAGKYIVTFHDGPNIVLSSLFHNLYYDTARIVLTPDIYFEISIADVTKHRYDIPSKFKTDGPYKKCEKPFILYKKDVPRAFSCEFNEVNTEIYSVPL